MLRRKVVWIMLRLKVVPCWVCSPPMLAHLRTQESLQDEVF